MEKGIYGRERNKQSTRGERDKRKGRREKKTKGNKSDHHRKERTKMKRIGKEKWKKEK